MIRGGIVTLVVKDVGRAVRFYVETLGLKLAEEAADGSSIIDAGEGFSMRLRAGDAPAGTPITLRTKVPLAEAVAIYENRGVVFTVEGTGDSAVARFQDPDANALELTSSA